MWIGDVIPVNKLVPILVRLFWLKKVILVKFWLFLKQSFEIVFTLIGILIVCKLIQKPIEPWPKVVTLSGISICVTRSQKINILLG